MSRRYPKAKRHVSVRTATGRIRMRPGTITGVTGANVAVRVGHHSETLASISKTPRANHTYLQSDVTV